MAQTISIQALEKLETSALDLSAPIPLQLDNVDKFNSAELGQIKDLIYAYCDTSADNPQKVAYLTNFPSCTLRQGSTVSVKFKYANTSDNVSLKLQSSSKSDLTGNISVMALNSANLQLGAGSWKAGAVLMLEYDGTYWQAHTDIVKSSSSEVLHADGTTSYTAISSLDTTSSAPVNSSAVAGAIVSADSDMKAGTCLTEASEETKEVTLTDYVGTTLPGSFYVEFTYANSYGETTATAPTYPKILLKNKNGAELGTLNVCDSRGHVAGKGCWNADDIMQFRIVGDKACIINSDVRESVSGTSGYTIYSNGKKGYGQEVIDLDFSEFGLLSQESTTDTRNSIKKVGNLIEINIAMFTNGTISDFSNQWGFKIPDSCKPKKIVYMPIQTQLGSSFLVVNTNGYVSFSAFIGNSQVSYIQSGIWYWGHITYTV